MKQESLPLHRNSQENLTAKMPMDIMLGNGMQNFNEKQLASGRIFSAQ